MFTANYRITNTILKNIGRIDACREIISRTLPIVPALDSKIKREAQVRIVFNSLVLDGNRLEEDEVRDLLDGREVIGLQKDIQEVLNYRNTLIFIGQIVKTIGIGKPYILTIETVSELQKLLTINCLPEEYCGTLRTRQIVVREAHTGKITYTPPPGVEVPYLLEDLVNWINSEEIKDLHPIVKAAVVHYEIMRIHPFFDGNGRTARSLALLLLYLDGYDFGSYFCLEDYYSRQIHEYYRILQDVSNQEVLDIDELDLTSWLEFFVLGAADEFQKLTDKVTRISSESQVKDKLGAKVELNERQMLIMEYLHRHKSMQNRDFRKIFPDFSDDTVLRELKFLKQKGLVKKMGGTKKAAYVLR